MFATHDQENLVSVHQTAAATKQQQQNARTLQPKTPGARYPKTPLKIPLNDVRGFGRGAGGKHVLGINKPIADRSQFVTPGEPRTGRPVLGDKTTNAKSRRDQTIAAKAPAVREPTTVASRPKSFAPKTDSSKLQILLDHSDPLSDEVDTNPEPPPQMPYQSDVWPADIITFDAAKPANRLTGYYDWYHNRRDENGETRIDREMKAKQEQRFREGEAHIRKEIDEMTFDLGLESPKKKQQPLPMLAPQDPNKKATRPAVTAGKTVPSTLNSRRAASALSMAPPTKAPSSSTSTPMQRKPLSAKPVSSYMQPVRARHQPQQQQAPNFNATTLASRPKVSGPSSTAAGLAASRSTLGYHKGRTARSVLDARSANPNKAALPLAARSETVASGKTITPASYARDATEARPDFVSIFDVPLDEADADLFGSGPGIESLFGDEDGEDEDDFQLDLQL
ncbi:unnamed protein product [Discula destructiva]